VELCPEKAPVAQEQDLTRTRRKHNAAVQGEGGCDGDPSWRVSPGFIPIRSTIRRTSLSENHEVATVHVEK
jgi:hypothetical protein